VQAKERRNVELKKIIPHGLGDGVRPITKWAKLPMGSCKAFFHLESKPALIQRLSLRPPATALSGSQQCYAKGSYGSRTTSRYLSLSFQCPSLLAAWTGCPDTFHLCFVLYSVGWGRPFLAFVVRGSQAQIAASFV
jgi:hypothetical protein